MNPTESYRIRIKIKRCTIINHVYLLFAVNDVAAIQKYIIMVNLNKIIIITIGFTNGEELGDPCCLWTSGDEMSPYMDAFVRRHSTGFAPRGVAPRGSLHEGIADYF